MSVSASSYRVRSGDCLWKIARQHGVSLQSVIRANPQIKNPDLIHPDDTVNIPGAGGGGEAKPKRGGLVGLIDRAKDKFVEGAKKAGEAIKGGFGRVLDIARNQVGTPEYGNNAGPITKYTGGKTGWPWCAKFISWVYRQSGKPLPGGDQWAVAGIKSIIQRLGQWKGPSQLQPGMAVTFRNFSHVELIGKPVYQSGRLTGYMTYGGNTTMSNGRQGVAYKFRPLSELEGGGFPVDV